MARSLLGKALLGKEAVYYHSLGQFLGHKDTFSGSETLNVFLISAEDWPDGSGRIILGSLRAKQSIINLQLTQRVDDQVIVRHRICTEYHGEELSVYHP